MIKKNTKKMVKQAFDEIQQIKSASRLKRSKMISQKSEFEKDFLEFQSDIDKLRKSIQKTMQ